MKDLQKWEHHLQFFWNGIEWRLLVIDSILGGRVDGGYFLFVCLFAFLSFWKYGLLQGPSSNFGLYPMYHTISVAGGHWPYSKQLWTILTPSEPHKSPYFIPWFIWFSRHRFFTIPKTSFWKHDVQESNIVPRKNYWSCKF